MALRHLIRLLGSSAKDASNLSREDARRAFDSILRGAESDVAIATFLISLRWKGITVEELTGFGDACRMHARLPCTEMEGLVCVSPPHDGHEQHPPLDVASGLVAAAAGARVLIVSDRSVPPLRGLTAANVLEHLGLAMTWDPTEAEDWVAKGRFAPLAISGILPALLELRRVRRDVGVRTALSTVEKLLAPPGSAVVLGAQGGPVLGRAAEVVQALGHERGIVIQGIDGGVNPSVRRRSRGIELSGHHLVPVTVEPDDFGLGARSEPELPMFGPPDDGLGAADNPALVESAGEVTRSVLEGETGPARNSTLLGAAVILKASGRCLTLAEGVDAATAALDSGAARDSVAYLKSLIS